MACYFTIHGWPISDCTAEGVKTVVCYHLYHVLTSKKNDISYFGNIIAPPPPPHPPSPPSLSARAGGGGGGRTGGGGAAAEEGVLAQATQLSKGVEGVLDQVGRRSVSLSSPRRT